MIPVPPVGFVPLTPVDTAPTEGTSASAAAAGTQDARIAPAWPLTLRVKPVTGEHAMVVTSHPLASDVGVDILRRGGQAGGPAPAGGVALAVGAPPAGNIYRKRPPLYSRSSQISNAGSCLLTTKAPTS